MQELPGKTKNMQLFHISVKACIVVDDKFLLMKGKKEPNNIQSDKWEFPGGRIDKGEYVEETLRRELIEEIGFKSKDLMQYSTPYKLLNRYEYALYKDFDICIFEAVYKVELKTIPDITISDEHCEYKWIEADTDLNKLEFKTDEQKKLFLEIQKEICR